MPNQARATTVFVQAYACSCNLLCLALAEGRFTVITGADVGKRVEIINGVLRVDGVERVVQWGTTRHANFSVLSYWPTKISSMRLIALFYFFFAVFGFSVGQAYRLLRYNHKCGSEEAW